MDMARIFVFQLFPALLATVIPASVSSQTGQPTVAAAPATFYAIIYREGPAWKTGQPMQKQALGEHLRYYRRGLEEGRVFAAGGLLAIDGGLAILRVSNLDEAKAFLAADPAVLTGILVGEAYAWTTPFVSKEPLNFAD